MQQVLLYTLNECMPLLPWAGTAYAFVLIIIGVTRIKEVDFYIYRQITFEFFNIQKYIVH